MKKIHHEGIITETYKSPDKSYLKQPQELTDLVDSTKLIHKHLPKQVDIDKILNIIKRNMLKGTHLPLTIMEIQVGYLDSMFFGDLYSYMAQNKLTSKNAKHKVLTLSQKLYPVRSATIQTHNSTRQRKSLIGNS